MKNKKGFDVLRASIVSIVKGGEKRMNTLDGTGQKNNFTQTYEAYVNDIYRLCFSFMKIIWMRRILCMRHF